MHCSSLLFLVGGGRDPRYPPNKVIFWNEALGKEVAELEFREKVRGLACRRGWLAVALRRRVVAFEIGESVRRYGEWDTYENTRGEHVLLHQCGDISRLARICVRCHSHRHWRILNCTRRARATTRTCTIYPSPALSSTRSHWPASFYSSSAATTSNQAPAFCHCRAQHCYHDPGCHTNRAIARYCFRPRDADSRVGYCYWEAGPRVKARLRSSRDLRRRFSP